MGYTTDYIGHVDIHPQLNDAEMSYLSAFVRSRRWHRPGGPYVVPGNPAAEAAEDQIRPDDNPQINQVADGQPGLWCGWAPCWDGCCLAFDGIEKFYDPTRWMEYLIDHFLRPGAEAAQSELDCFDEFTFDHHLDGIIAGCRRDTKELFLIRVEDNLVFEEILRPGDRDLEYREMLAYEAYLEKQEARSRRRRLRTVD